MDWTVYLLLFAAGTAAGIINTVAGGGSVLTLPALIFAGVPAGIANATIRIGIIAQNITAVRQFRRGGVHEWPFTWRTTVVGLAGSIVGAVLAAHIPDEQFERILGFLMLALLPLTLKKVPRASGADANPAALLDAWSPLSSRNRLLMLGSFFALGVYGGFLQAGIGIMILLVLQHTIHMPLVLGNYVKLVFVMAATMVALAVFVAQGIEIEWVAGLVLSAGQILGAYAGSWVAIRRGEQWIRGVMVFSILLSSGKLLGLFD